LQNIQSANGFELKASTGTTFNLFRNGSASGTAQGVLQDNGDRGGGGVATTNPPATFLTGAGTVTLSSTAPTLPNIVPALQFAGTSDGSGVVSAPVDSSKGVPVGSNDALLPRSGGDTSVIAQPKPSGLLSAGQLNSIVSAAIVRWDAAGITAD